MFEKLLDQTDKTVLELSITNDDGSKDTTLLKLEMDGYARVYPDTVAEEGTRTFFTDENCRKELRDFAETIAAYNDVKIMRYDIQYFKDNEDKPLYHSTFDFTKEAVARTLDEFEPHKKQQEYDKD